MDWAGRQRVRMSKSGLVITAVVTVKLIMRLRKDLAGQGLDVGPQTISGHLEHRHQVKVSAATVSRTLSRRGLVTPDPSKRPRSSCITDVSTELSGTTCRTCRSQLGLDDSDEANGRLEALFVISMTMGLRPGELRTLTWDHVDLNREWSTSGARLARAATPRRPSPSARWNFSSARSPR